MADVTNASAMAPQYGMNTAMNGNFGGFSAFPFFNGPDMEIPPNFDWVSPMRAFCPVSASLYYTMI